MKRHILILPLVLLLFTITSCKKNTEKQPKETSETVSYKATDGSRANATFETNKSGSTVTIYANKNKFQLDKKSETLYERNGVKAEFKGDSLIIKQGDIEIPLVKSLP